MPASKRPGRVDTIDAGDNFVITAPGLTVTASDAAPTARQRGARAGAAAGDRVSPLLDEALRRGDLSERKAIALDVSMPAAPDRPTTRSAGKRATRAAEAAEPTVTVSAPPPGPGEAQLIMAVDETGAVSWHLPEPAPPTAAAPATRSARTRGAAAPQRFVVPVRLAEPPVPGTKRTRGIVGAASRVVLKVLVYPVTDVLVGAAAKHFARRWEEKNRPYRVRDFSPANYQSATAPSLGAADWQRLAAGRSLLFVHGTFSTAHGGFGALPEATMQELHRRYGGRVFAVNLFTLSDDPADNARWLLSQVPAGLRLQLDIVCHSRGGLVSREIQRQAAARAGGPGLDVQSVVFVAVPNAGTPLADPDYMVNMVDRLTTAINVIPAGPVAEVLDALITTVKVIAHGALGSLRGLASMQPKGKFLKALGTGVRSAARYYSLGADFEPEPGGPFFSLVKLRAGDRVLDRVFKDEANDLVVPTKGTREAEGAHGFPIQLTDCHLFDHRANVIHTTYFAQPRTSEALLQWLSPAAASHATSQAAGHAAPRDEVLAWIDEATAVGGSTGRPTRQTRGARSRNPEGGQRIGGTVSPGLPSMPPFTGGGPGSAPPDDLEASGPPMPAMRSARSTRSVRARPPAPTAPAPQSAGPEADEGTSISRDPSIGVAPAPVPGKPVEVRVDLLYKEVDADTEGGAVGFRSLPTDWSDIDVEVRVDAPDLDFAAGGDRGTITVRRNAASVPCVLQATVRAEAAERESIDVVASFFHKGRFSGMARRTVAVEQPARTARKGAARKTASKQAASKQAAATADGAGDTRGSAVIDTRSEAPRMTVVIVPLGSVATGDLLWRIEVDGDVDGLPDKLHGSCALGAESHKFVREMYGQLANAAPREGTTPAQHAALFQGMGDRIWEVTPDCFKKTYWALRDRYGAGFPIQFVSGEPNMPWELMRPYDERTGTPTGLLAVEHPVGRWLLDYEGAMRGTLPSGGVVSIAPDYARERREVNPLPEAQVEAALLAKKYKARRISPASRQHVLDLLQKDSAEPVAVLHFAGHGEFGDVSANGSIVYLGDGDLQIMEVRNKSTRLGRQHGTFVVFNACEVAGTGAVLNSIGGWAEAFLNARFGGFLAPLWPVYDDDASDVVAEFFEHGVKNKQPIGEVVRGIRARHQDASATFLSYIYYGDVMARFA